MRLGTYTGGSGVTPSHPERRGEEARSAVASCTEQELSSFAASSRGEERHRCEDGLRVFQCTSDLHNALRLLSWCLSARHWGKSGVVAYAEIVCSLSWGILKR